MVDSHSVANPEVYFSLSNPPPSAGLPPTLPNKQMVSGCYNNPYLMLLTGEWRPPMTPGSLSMPMALWGCWHCRSRGLWRGWKTQHKGMGNDKSYSKAIVTLQCSSAIKSSPIYSHQLPREWRWDGHSIALHFFNLFFNWRIIALQNLDVSSILHT